MSYTAVNNETEYEWPYKVTYIRESNLIWWSWAVYRFQSESSTWLLVAAGKERSMTAAMTAASKVTGQT